MDASGDDQSKTIKLDPDAMPKGFPDELIEIIEERPFIVGGEEKRETQLIETGKCVACECDLGDDTMIVLNGDGIQAIACGGPCHDDMMIYGYLNEQAQDVRDRVSMRQKLRGGHD